MDAGTERSLAVVPMTASVLRLDEWGDPLRSLNPSVP